MKYFIIYLMLVLNIGSSSYAAVHSEHNKISKTPISIKNASSAKEAKLLGLEEAKRKSLAILLARIYPKKKINLEAVSNEDIENFITGFEIYQEKFSTNSYHALVDVSFNLNLIRKKFDNFSGEDSVQPEAVVSPHNLYSEKGNCSQHEDEQKLITCYSKINNLTSWADIRDILQNKVKSIENVKPLFIDNNMIIFEIIFSNDPSITAESISENMALHGIFLEIDEENKIELKYHK